MFIYVFKEELNSIWRFFSRIIKSTFKPYSEINIIFENHIINLKKEVDLWKNKKIEYLDSYESHLVETEEDVFKKRWSDEEEEIVFIARDAIKGLDIIKDIFIKNKDQSINKDKIVNSEDEILEYWGIGIICALANREIENERYKIHHGFFSYHGNGYFLILELVTISNEKYGKKLLRKLNPKIQTSKLGKEALNRHIKSELFRIRKEHQSTTGMY